MLSDFDVEFVDTGYGKDYVKLLHIRREGKWHYIKELEVNTALTLNNYKDYTHGDNSDIIATDSQKNTVYVIAKQKGIKNSESFAIDLCHHFLTKYAHVIHVKVHIEEAPWRRVSKDGVEHVHAFIHSPEARRFCNVQQDKHGVPQVDAGLTDMKVLKTTKSAFTNFVDDEYRTLPDAQDRIFCTVVKSQWWYHNIRDLDFDRAWETVKSAIVDTFVGPPDTGIFSASVQKTLYDAGKLALSKVPQMSKIEITMPNVHNFAVDFTKFKKLHLGPNEDVFTPFDKPSGNIRAILGRRSLSSKL